jgi:hypothetical protein
MKNRFNFIIAAITIVALGATLFVGCKKENTNAGIVQNTSTKEFTPPQVDDMNAYLKNFKQKMKSATKDEGEALSLDEAAWHLASIANYEYANASVTFDNVRFDTIDFQVAVTNGTLLLSDLNSAYEIMCADIQDFENNLRLNNKNLRFINMFISKNGTAIVTLVNSFNNATKDLDDHYWYFNPSVDMDSICELYYYEDSTYTWDGTAQRELARILNLFESYQNGPDVSYFTPAESQTFEYNHVDWFDPYGSPFHMNSRLCAFYDYSFHDLSMEEMCYCVDSYLGLGYDYLQNANPLKRPVCWEVSNGERLFYEYHDRSTTFFHKLTIQYGYLHNGKPITND